MDPAIAREALSFSFACAQMCAVCRMGMPDCLELASATSWVVGSMPEGSGRLGGNVLGSSWGISGRGATKGGCFGLGMAETGTPRGGCLGVLGGGLKQQKSKEAEIKI